MNDLQSAYEKLNVGVKHYGTLKDRLTSAEHNSVLFALEKQIPEKPNRNIPGNAVCPDCEMAGLHLMPKYCPKCGKRLDWSDENDRTEKHH